MHARTDFIFIHETLTSLQGSLTQLNVRQPMFLGGFRGKVNPDSGIEKGFDGAIQRFIVNGDLYDDLVVRARRTHKISRYMGYPCHKNNPCLNGGVCVPELGDFSCKCPMKHMGKFCERCKILFITNINFLNIYSSQYDT